MERWVWPSAAKHEEQKKCALVLARLCVAVLSVVAQRVCMRFVITFFS
jgi:hypothetical protein